MTNRRSRWIAALPEGPVDVIGDVHGEHEALRNLLEHLGYDEAGRHPESRFLVFAGDLTDRGPDSIGVVRRVKDLVGRGRAVCLMGNHELNVLRGDLKHGNAWALAVPPGKEKGRFPHSAEGEEAAAFFRDLPIAAAHEHLRVVHASWSDEAFGTLDALPADVDTQTAFEQFELKATRGLVEEGLQAAQERAEHALGPALRDKSFDMPMQADIGRADEYRQMRNPLRVLTSGPERMGEKPFYSSGKWRFADRERWWDGYAGSADVVFGHYWRWPVPVDRAAVGKGDPDLFEEVPVHAWLGPERRAFCVDYGVGRRAEERRKGAASPGHNNKLAALRWNGRAEEHLLVFDDGAVRRTVRQK